MYLSVTVRDFSLSVDFIERSSNSELSRRVFVHALVSRGLELLQSVEPSCRTVLWWSKGLQKLLPF